MNNLTTSVYSYVKYILVLITIPIHKAIKKFISFTLFLKFYMSYCAVSSVIFHVVLFLFSPIVLLG